MIIDRLIDAIRQKNNPSVAGIDTCLDYLPEVMTERCDSLDAAADAIEEFNRAVIDGIADIVPAVKVQVAYYEMYGVAGMRCFANTLSYAKKKGLIVIADVKRNDIGSTAACYSRAYLGKTLVGGNEFSAFNSDFVTINGYLGSDGMVPFTDDCKKYDKGAFVLIKTSNPSSGEFQDRVYEDGDTLYRAMAASVVKWGGDLVGKYGYSSIGGVIGATKPVQADDIRKNFGGLFFLVPGYGAQGASADDIVNCFDDRGLGAIVNSSRAILTAYKKPQYAGLNYASAARQAAVDMREDITSALKRNGKELKG